MRKSIQDIAAERTRQIEKEGFGAENDANYEDNELALAAACYAVSHNSRVLVVDLDQLELDGPLDTLGHEVETAIDEADAFPFNDAWYKAGKHGLRKSLVIAGALIAAQIDKLDADEESESHGS